MTTEERFAKLERELAAAKRRIRWMLTAGCLAVLGLSTVGFVAKQPETITAKNFTVVDDSGKALAVFGASKEGVLLKMNDANGNARLKLLTTNRGSMVSLGDETGKPRVGLTMLGDGARLELFGDKGQSRALLVADKEPPRLDMWDENGKSFRATP